MNCSGALFIKNFVILKEKMNIDLRPLIGISLFFLWLILFVLSTSCTTMRNAERRHDRIVANFPSVHKVDTVEVEKIVEVEVIGFRDSNILIFDTINAQPIYDTIYLQDSVVVINTIWRSENGRNNLKTDVIVPNRKVIVKWKDKQVVIYEKQPCKWWKGFPFYMLSALVIGFIGGILYKNEKK